MSDYTTCPYHGISLQQRWDQAVAAVDRRDIDPGVIGQAPVISASTRIGAGGSCFAQRISETLRSVGYNFVDTEPAPKWLQTEKQKSYGYGLYSGRYGNIYTALQLCQLIERSLGNYAASDEMWSSNGRFFDPLRPRITPTGYASAAELSADRDNHLRCTKRIFEEVEVFVFTLGLTETWIRNSDGAALPVCPGCGVGTFDESLYTYKNFDVFEVVEHLSRFMETLAVVNPAASVILTVSPVPLAATMEPHHVLLSTSYSKAVLRIAAQTIVSRFANACYFPSYEIITQTLNGADYFSEDKRNVTDLGVSHVMRSFFKQFAAVDYDSLSRIEEVIKAPASSAVVCDEEELAQALATRRLGESAA